jgi:hypothetical protein
MYTVRAKEDAMRLRANLLEAVPIIAALFTLSALSIGGGCRADQTHSGAPAAIEVQCDADLGLAEASGIMIDWDEQERRWSYSVDAEQITLTRDGLCGDECRFLEVLKLVNISGPCPQFVSAVYMHSDVGGAQGAVSDTTWAEEGILKIENWEYPGGIISGTLETEVMFTFYITLEQK